MWKIRQWKLTPVLVGIWFLIEYFVQLVLASYTSSFNYWRRNFPIKSHICLLLSRSLVIFLKKKGSYTSILCFLLGSIHMWALWESSQVEAVSGHTHQNVPQGKQSYLSSFDLSVYLCINSFLSLLIPILIYLFI